MAEKKNSKPADLLQKEIKRKQRAAARKAAGVKGKPRGKPFAEGEDERRNVKGSKPRTAQMYKDMILNIFAEEMETPNPLTGKQEKITYAYAMARRMILGSAPADHSEILNRSLGKVPDEIRMHFDVDQFMTKYMDRFTDGQLERILNGEHPLDILAESLDIQQRTPIKDQKSK